jgi:hypothetical protein
MGKYLINYDIYGILIYSMDEDDISKTLYEKQYNHIITKKEIEEAHAFYKQMKINTNLFVKVYKQCKNTIAPNNLSDINMQWFPISYNVLFS